MEDTEPRLEVESRESVRINGRSGWRLPPAASSIFLASSDSINVRCRPDTIDVKDVVPVVVEVELLVLVVVVEDVAAVVGDDIIADFLSSNTNLRLAVSRNRHRTHD